jgi:hypothetical protein
LHRLLWSDLSFTIKVKQAIKDAKNAFRSSGGQANKLAFSLLLVSFVLPPAVACGLAYAKTTSDDAFLESVSEIATTWSGLVVVVSTSNILRHGWARSKGCVCGALRWSVIKKLVRASLRGSLACSVRFTLRLGQACGRTALFALSVAGLPSEVLLDKHPWLEEPFSLARAVVGSFFVVYACLWCLKEYVFKWRHRRQEHARPLAARQGPDPPVLDACERARLRERRVIALASVYPRSRGTLQLEILELPPSPKIALSMCS